MKKNNFIVVSFYTKETGYEREATKLIEMLKRYGLDWHIEPIRNLGSWQANTYYKAEFLKKTMGRYPNQDIVWLDVDSVLHKYPVLFDTIDADLGVHFIDWERYGRGRSSELDSAVMFIKNNDKMCYLIEAWIEENQRMISSGSWEQRNLQEILTRHTEINIVNLPAEYCKIFDLMALVKNPVIEQMQVSRKYRAEVNKEK